MIQIALKRLAHSLIVLSLLMTSVFFLIRFAPGGPFDSERALPAEVQRQIEQKYGLDAPLWVQFGRWARASLEGDFGNSFQHPDRPVSEIVLSALPNSLSLGGIAFLAAMLIGIPIGIYSGASRNALWDRLVRLLLLSSVSLPGFLVASLLVWIFSIHLNLFPPALWDGPEHWILPTVTLMLRPMALITRLMRGSVKDVLQQDFIRTARAKGLSRHTVLWRHALRNAWIPCIGLLGPVAAHLLTGSFLVESIFQIPGLGRYFVSAVLNRDYSLVMGTTLVFGLILVLFNAVTEVLLSWADPRLRTPRRSS
ncbi:MAG: ABC transporter permease [Bdellovibrionales bacterium]|nr:ABC transporter permease [Bdellovibrionales bacterium]